MYAPISTNQPNSNLIVYQQPMMVQQPMMQPQMMQPQMMQPQMMQGQMMMQPQMMMMQPQMMMMPQMMELGGFNRLLASKGVFIKQKLELLEVVTGCQTENSYNVFELGEDGEKKGEAFLKAKEKSDTCARIFLPSSCRPFKMKINHKGGNQDHNNFLDMDREYTCTCFCLNRPEMTVTNTENGENNRIGKVTNPFLCCDYGVDVYDKDNMITHLIRGDCCQLGIWCPLPCKDCQIVNFDIKTSNGQKVAQLTKKPTGFCKAAVSEVSYFAVEFPQNATKEERALLMASAIMLDFQYFEENDDNDNNKQF